MKFQVYNDNIGKDTLNSETLPIKFDGYISNQQITLNLDLFYETTNVGFININVEIEKIKPSENQIIGDDVNNELDNLKQQVNDEACVCRIIW